MLMSKFSRRFRAALVVSVIAFAGPSAADSFPDRAVTIVVPFSAGSGTDTGTRVLAEALEPLLGQGVIVDNRPGGNGAIAAGLVADADPDGYTLLMGTNSTQSANPLLIKSLSYDPAKDFVPIGMLATFEGILAVNPEQLPFSTVDELVTHIRAHPGEVSFATGNVTSLVMASIFARDLGLDILRVPYKSNPEALTDVVSGQVDMMFPDIASSMSQIKAGRLKALGSVTLGEATPLAPDLKPLSQTVSPNLKLVGWIGLFAPAGTPQEVVEKLSAAVKEVAESQQFVEKLGTMGANANFLPSAELKAYIDTERASFAQIFDEMGMEPQ
ncbi:Bug family tripartite tricarboxylate transporter substrate binding protein [Tianweitania sediminis]|uniref:Tripartite tricarboxylate transporter substrate binding protein n=1 Tax=Tianweitania sediminis TaxID=1502156 RepID=A0A8J7R3G0_9HYPH|nr:tripartite tricarboxylate transporter substrate binding protein [Tianweitania sediminis]MBP0441170.1 tripartite tricarboxylate transporter substrate binding protein [Tianweitania sediminis]